MSILWSGLFRRLATAIGIGDRNQKRKSTLRTAAIVIGMVREYKITSLDKIEDAVIGEIQSEAMEARAEAESRVAEAAEKQARCALALAEANLINARAHVLVEDSASNAEIKRMKAIADAVGKLADAAGKLTRAGGSVVVIESEITALLRSGRQEFPTDKIITDAQVHLTEAET